MDGKLPGSSLHGISQARILEWVAISCSRGSSWPRDLTWASCVSCIGRVFLYLPLHHLGSPYHELGGLNNRAFFLRILRLGSLEIRVPAWSGSGEGSLPSFQTATFSRVIPWWTESDPISLPLLLFSCSVISSSLWPYALQHDRLPCPSPFPGFYPNSCLLSRWCHPTISSSVTPFFSCPQSFPASGSFSVSQLFTSGGQSIGASASASVFPMNIQGWFPLGLTGVISLQSKGLSNPILRALLSSPHLNLKT